MTSATRNRTYAGLPVLLTLLVVVTLAIGTIVLHYLQDQLIAATGENLALAAADIADKLDRTLFERYSDIQLMAKAPALQGRDAAAKTKLLNTYKEMHSYYAWIAVTDATGRIVAATNPAGIGQDHSERQWFRFVRDQGRTHVRDAELSEEAGGVQAIGFTAPIKSPAGAFLGAVTSRVRISDLERVFEWTERAFQIQRGKAGRIEWQFMTRDGDLIADSLLHEEGRTNIKTLGLPSALFTGSAQPGYVEEMHLRRHVPVVSGFAQTEQYGDFLGLHWGILVRMDRSDILAPVQAVLWKVGAAGALVFVPMLGFLLWSTARLRHEWAIAQEEKARATKAEAEARESDARTRRIINTALDAVIVMDAHGRITEWNPQAEATFGWTRDEAMGRSLADTIIPPQYREAHVQGLNRFLTTGEGPVLNRRIEITALHRDGREFPVELTISPVQAGSALTFSAFVRDITERKRSEEELRKTEEQLRQSQKMEAVGQLAGGIAHDFNNLLTVILGYIELLLRDLQPEQRGWKNAEQIRKAAARAAVLTQQLLAFSRRQVLAPKVLDLNAVATNLEPMLRRLIGEDIELGIAPHPALGQVLADPGQIDQIILNLVINARDAMPQGGRLTIETTNVELDKSYARQHVEIQTGPYVMLAVSDTGCGMDADSQSRIFEPFFTTKEQGKGTGLGLSTVYGIVKQSGGDLWVYSEVGRGTTFKIYLPRIEEAPEGVEPGSAPSQSFAGQETIMLVEDEDAVRELVMDVLEANGYTVLVARHSEEAFKLNGRYKGLIHLLLTDVVMPKMSGRELAERLRSSRPRMKVLYMSGYTDDAVVRHGVLAEGTAFLQKPFTPNALLQKVHEILGSSAMGRLV